MRQGGCHRVLVCEPLRGWRHLTVSDRRPRRDWAPGIKDLVDVHYPDAERIVLVQDTLHTHPPASLDEAFPHEAFPPTDAQRLTDKVALHDPPQHGSWLNMAAIDLRALATRCLDRRLPDRATLEAEAAAGEAARTAGTRTITCRFTTADARMKLAHRYPSSDG